jgi:hypothetical protein
MKMINKNATKIFCRLLKKLGGRVYIKLLSEGYMPLTIECVLENIKTPFGEAALYSLCHYFEQNGDLMRDPEMCFLVVDNRRESNQYDLIGIYPQMYRMDGLGLDRESIRIENGKMVSFRAFMQRDHAIFACSWLKNIRQQGFLK